MAHTDAEPDPADQLLRGLGKYPGLLVALSAGVDSSFLLATALEALGPDRVAAVTASGPSLPVVELDRARAFTASLGVRHVVARTDEMSRRGYRENGTSRCYFCKAALLDVVGAYLSLLPPGARVATGTNADDVVEGFRPGIRAAAQRGAVTPLADAGMTKEQIRRAARARGLGVWDKPQAACLSSRIAYGIGISPARLARVEAAEIAVRDCLERHGLRTVNLRVRDLGDRARVEVDRDLVEVPGPWRTGVLEAVLHAGFDSAHVDPRGFRSGSMNEGLTPPA
jgi:uncharacterized protein